MSELIVRCDDFGLTQGCSLGILRALENGCISSVGVIVNTGVRSVDARSLAAHEGISIGLHVNVVAGRPVSNSTLDSGLVDDEGNFFPSRRYRTSEVDLIDADEIETEAQAQVDKFQSLFGMLPAYIDCHSVGTPHVDEGLSRVAKRIGVPYVDFTLTSLREHSCIYTPDLPNNMVYDSYDPLHFLMSSESGILTHEKTFVVFHPAFLDESLMEISSLREGRMKDQAALSSPALKKWLDDNDVMLRPIGFGC